MVSYHGERERLSILGGSSTVEILKNSFSPVPPEGGLVCSRHKGAGRGRTSVLILEKREGGLYFLSGGEGGKGVAREEKAPAEGFHPSALEKRGGKGWKVAPLGRRSHSKEKNDSLRSQRGSGLGTRGKGIGCRDSCLCEEGEKGRKTTIFPARTSPRRLKGKRLRSWATRDR